MSISAPVHHDEDEVLLGIDDERAPATSLRGCRPAAEEGAVAEKTPAQPCLKLGSFLPPVVGGNSLELCCGVISAAAFFETRRLPSSSPPFR
jgi:hypothetical protein